MPETLIEVAAEFGALSPDIVSHARTDINPRLAMTELRHLFPHAFKPAFDARTATKAECDAMMRKLQADENRLRCEHAARFDAAEQERRGAREREAVRIASKSAGVE